MASADATNADGCAPRPLPEGPPDTAPAGQRDEPGRGTWSSRTGRWVRPSRAAGQGHAGNSGEPGKPGARGVRKEKGGAGSEPGGTQACGKEFRIAASLCQARPGHSPTVWAWNLSRHPGMQRGDAGGHCTAGGTRTQRAGNLRTMLPLSSPGAPGTPSTHPNCAR